MFAKIAIAAVVLVALPAVVVATRAAAFRIQRSTVIAAPAEVVFAQLDDFHRWSAWSPYERMDPSLSRSFQGAPSGVGAVYHYAGGRVGEGRMTVVESRPGERLGIAAEFIRPFAARNHIEFTLQPAAGGVRVTWAMSGTNGFLARAFSLVVNVDRMVGGDFEKGLAELKRVSEAEAARAVTAA
jgi:polyketide cyclase/dehydrase/lipid transport protein